MRMHWIRILMTHNADGVPNKSPTKFLLFLDLPVGSNISFTLIENNFRFLIKIA